MMRYELTDYEWAAIRLMLPNKARGAPEFRNNPDDNFMVALFADHWLR